MTSAAVSSNSDPFKVWDFEKYISKFNITGIKLSTYKTILEPLHTEY